MPRTKLLPTTIATVALLVGLSACGSSAPDAERSTTTEASSSDGSSGSDTTTTGDDADESTTTVVATGGGDFCENLADYINASMTSDVDVTDEEAFKAELKKNAEEGKELLEDAPSELDGPVDLLLETQDRLLSELEKVDYDFAKLPPEVAAASSSPELVEAQEELQAYVEDTCGIDIPDTPVADAETIPAPTQPS